MTINILIYVRGGVVQDIYSDNQDVSATLIDMDNIKGGFQDYPIELDNYPVELTSEQHLQEMITDANKVIAKNKEKEF